MNKIKIHTLKNTGYIILIVILFYGCVKQSELNTGSLKTSDEIEIKIDLLLKEMTLKEKIGQMIQLNERYGHDSLLKEGMIGSLLNVVNAETVNRLQRIAVEESRLGIPLLFGRDVIHGFNTILPIPLGQAATWNPELVKKGAHIAAVEARKNGVNWTFAPMLDISRDPRWGRIAETLGEDPYLTSVLGVAMVKGFQGDQLNSKNSK